MRGPRYPCLCLYAGLPVELGARRVNHILYLEGSLTIQTSLLFLRSVAVWPARSPWPGVFLQNGAIHLNMEAHPCRHQVPQGLSTGLDPKNKTECTVKGLVLSGPKFTTDIRAR